MMKFIMNAKPTRMWIDGKSFIIKRSPKKDTKTFRKEVIQEAVSDLVVSKRNTSETATVLKQDRVASKAGEECGVTIDIDEKFAVDVDIVEKPSSKQVEVASEAAENCPVDVYIDEKFAMDVDIIEKQEVLHLDGSKTSAISESKSQEEDINSFNVTLENGKFSTRFRLPRKYYLRLGDMPNSILKNLCASTNTLILYPKHGKEGNITITGENEEEVCEARNSLHSVISDIRDSLMAQQFIALPILSREVKENFEKFKSAVLSLKDIKGIDESIFMKTEKLHLTVVVFALFDDFEKAEAIKALEDYKAGILNNIIKDKGPPQIKVSGIEIMNDNPKKVDVLFAKVKLLDETDDHSLQKVVNGLSDHFHQRGLVRRYEENVKLHMTLINTKYRKQSGSPKRWVKRQSIDASKILENFKDYDFGTSQLDSIRLCLMTTQGKDGFYESIATVSVP